LFVCFPWPFCVPFSSILIFLYSTSSLIPFLTCFHSSSYFSFCLC
jgi:hypothetical protein